MSTQAASLQRIQAVVIGAFAGGVEALRSLLADISCPRCQLQVRETRGKDPIAPGTICFAPSDYPLLFETAAGTCQEQRMGVVLTGSNHDGAAGLVAALRGGPADFVPALAEMVDRLKTLNKEVQI